MSTSTPPDGRDANTASRGRSDDQHLSLPAFHSVRETSREGVTTTSSNASGSRSRRSESHNTDVEPTQPVGRGSLRGSMQSDHGSNSKDKDKDRQKEKEKEKENDGPRHHTIRNSGGFLLGPVSNAKRLSRSSLTSSRIDTKVKRDDGVSDLSVPKKRQRNDVHGTSSFRSSPLASEVKHDAVFHNAANSDQLIPGTDIRRSLSSSQNGFGPNESILSNSDKAETQRTSMANVGYDHDPAQIVNMALSLSEGRRRLASGRRYVSSEQGDRRVISTSSTASPRGTVKRKSIAPFLAPNRQASRHTSPKLGPSARRDEVNVSRPSPPPDTEPVEMDDEDLDVDMDFADQISPATAARVEKAKAYFELAHEHRRLLSHLPPVRRPGTQILSSSPEAMQKAYNPLQYVRNRKLRIWEKTPFDSELEGWYDVEKVRPWVDAVLSSHPETQHGPLECVRLPPLDQHIPNSDGEDPDEPPNESKAGPSPRVPDQYHQKPTRPRSDWVTHPADLLADAYWLEQGSNKAKIQDRDNNLIYPPGTQFKYSGWRRETPMDFPANFQPQSPGWEPGKSSTEETHQSALPELPTFKSAHHAHKHGRHNRRRDKIRDSLQIKDASSSRERSRLRGKLLHDSSESENSASMSSDDAALARGRRRSRRKRKQSPSNGELGKWGSNFQSKQYSSMFGFNPGDSSQGSSAPDSKRSSVDHAAFNKIFRVESLKKASPLNRSRNRNEASRPESGQAGATRSSLEHELPARASTDYDAATAPSSPSVVQWPSIAINLSPPPSRTTSPTRKAMSTILHPFHRKPHKEHDQISTTDFASVLPTETSPHHEPLDADKDVNGNDSRGTSPMARGLSPFSKNREQSTQSDDIALHSSNEQKLSAASKTTTRSTLNTGSEHSKVRGIFKGGRIAELVGNEVSRVGDFIWKREAPFVYKHRGSASDGSIRSYKGSDSDKDFHPNGSVLKTPPAPKDPRSRSSTISSTKSEQISPTISKLSPPDIDRPRYNNPNLPSFTSPFQRDRDQQERIKQDLLMPNSADIRDDPTDHISRLAAQHRSASHSPRLDRLPLPKLDTAGATSPSDLSRQKSYGFGTALDLSRSRDASDLLNSAISAGTPLKGLRATRSAGALGQTPGAGGSEAEEETPEPTDVSWRDIERARALLMSSTVKAREIGRRAEDENTELPKFLLDALTPDNRELVMASRLRVKKRERYIMAAQNIIKTLEGYSSTLHHKLDSFSSTLAPGLHTQLQTLEDMVENTMTPQVRNTTDRAGELSMKVTTTSTLAVKALNDSIEVALRRRRRGPVRLVRKIWFAGIEWTVVGLLWLIWAVVSVIQLVLCSVRAVVGVTRWLLWLD